MRWARTFLRPVGDDGFSLLESVIALAIAAVVFTALGAATISSVKSVLVGRTVQQAGDVAEQALEAMRAVGYDAAAMQSADLGVNEPLNLAGCSPNPCYDPVHNNVSGNAKEPLVLDPAGAISPHVITASPNASTVYTVRRYVTRPTDGTGAAYKRLTVVVSWTTRTDTRTRVVSSLITEKRSGLPLPDYKFANNGPTTACVSPGGQAILGFSLTNNGARDSWSITSLGGTQTWSYYLDDDPGSVGAFDPDDSQVPTVGGVPTIGPIDPTVTNLIWAVTDVSGGAAIGSSAVTFRVTSVAQTSYFQEVATVLQIAAACVANPTPSPTATPTSSPSSTPTPTVLPPTQPTTCTNTVPTPSPGSSATSTSYYLRNGATNTASTTASTPLLMQKLIAPTSTTLWDYSTDLSATTAGRYLATSGTSLATTAEWRYQFGAATKLVGGGIVSLWAGPASGVSTTPLTFTVTVKRLNSAGTVVSTIATTTYGSGAWNCGGFKPFGTSVSYGSGSGTSFSVNDFLSVSVTVSGGAALLGYDTTAMPSQVVLPVKSGG